jgi:hypothetical protein
MRRKVLIPKPKMDIASFAFTYFIIGVLYHVTNDYVTFCLTVNQPPAEATAAPNAAFAPTQDNPQTPCDCEESNGY